MLHFQDHFKGELAKSTGSLDVMAAYDAMLPVWPMQKFRGFSYERIAEPANRR